MTITYIHMYSAAQRHANIEMRSERNVNSFNSRGERVSFQALVQRTHSLKMFAEIRYCYIYCFCFGIFLLC